jgi:hypothetical protein
MERPKLTKSGSGRRSDYATVLRSPVFRACTLAAAASCGGLFAFISGSSFVLIRVLDVPASLFARASHSSSWASSQAPGRR